MGKPRHRVKVEFRRRGSGQGTDGIQNSRGFMASCFTHPNDSSLWCPLNGGWVGEGPMRADMESPFVLFTNMSSRFLRLRRGQII